MKQSFYSIPPEEEIRQLRLELQAKTLEIQKLLAISEQKNSFLLQQLEEVKTREANIKSMNDSIMLVLQDITNSNTKISTEIQLKQLIEDKFLSFSSKNPSNSIESEEQLKKFKLENSKMKELYEEKLLEIYKEKENLEERIHSLEEDKARLFFELQINSKTIADRLRLEFENEKSLYRSQYQPNNTSYDIDRGSLDLMKSQIKEMTTQHLVETNSLRTALTETRGKLERIYDAFCDVRDKNLSMKSMIQGFRAREMRLKEFLFERPGEFEEEDTLGLNFEPGYSNNMSLKGKNQKRAMEFSSIFDGFSSQDFIKGIPLENQLISPMNSDRFEFNHFQARGEIKKKRSFSQQIENKLMEGGKYIEGKFVEENVVNGKLNEIDKKTDEFSRPFEFDKVRYRNNMDGSSNKKEGNDSMDEFKTKEDISNVSIVSNYNEISSRAKKTMQSLV